MFTSSHRVNPVWQQAKENFLTQLGNVEHAGRMERIRLMGEQSRAYAQAQGEASDRQMRGNWEQQQASQDGQHTRFVQAIREVETWKRQQRQRRTHLRLRSRMEQGRWQLHPHQQPQLRSFFGIQDQAWKSMQQVQH